MKNQSILSCVTILFLLLESPAAGVDPAEDVKLSEHCRAHELFPAAQTE
jgi:hypothetical protein